jgi:hypothetical protein
MPISYSIILSVLSRLLISIQLYQESRDTLEPRGFREIWVLLDLLAQLVHRAIPVHRDRLVSAVILV